MIFGHDGKNLWAELWPAGFHTNLRFMGRDHATNCHVEVKGRSLWPHFFDLNVFRACRPLGTIPFRAEQSDGMQIVWHSVLIFSCLSFCMCVFPFVFCLFG